MLAACKRFAIFYLCWILVHYSASHLYTYLCTHLSLYGILISPFIVSTPHCTAIRWLISEGSNSIVAMWTAIGLFVLPYITKRAR
jgi:hypothetical protein